MMIPKSVSVSTRIVVLGAVMLIPAWGWAGDFDSTMPKPYAGGIVDCRYRYHGDGSMDKECKIREPYTCEQRMREAISNMKEQMRPNPNSRSLVRGFTMTEDAWNQSFEPIYQDCVEGR